GESVPVAATSILVYITLGIFVQIAFTLSSLALIVSVTRHQGFVRPTVIRALIGIISVPVFFFSSRRRHTSWPRDWSSDVCSSDLNALSGVRRRRLPTGGRSVLAMHEQWLPGPAQGAAPPLRLAPGDGHRAPRRKGHRPARRPWAGQGLRRPLHAHRRPARRPGPPRREIRREPRTGDRRLADAGAGRPRDRRARDGRRATAPRGQDLRPHRHPHDAHARRRARGDRAAGRARDRLRVEEDRLRRGGRVAGRQGGRRATSGGDDARRERIPRAGGKAMKPSRVLTVLAALVTISCVGKTTDTSAPLDIQSPGTWTALAPMPTARQEVAAAALDGRIFVIGGLGAGAEPVATVEVYDPGTDRWEARAPL